MEFNIETISGLTEGGTYIIEFSKDISRDECINITKIIASAFKASQYLILFVIGSSPLKFYYS